MRFIVAFIAAFVATLVFHQGALAALYAAGVAPVAPYPVRPTWPFGVPAVMSLAFWGGVWGVVLWAGIRYTSGWAYWSLWAGLGALAPTLAAMLVVFPLKGIPVGPTQWVGGFVLNGVWGVGTGLSIAAYARARLWLLRRNA